MELPKIELEKPCEEQILRGKDREVFLGSFGYSKFGIPIRFPKGDVE